MVVEKITRIIEKFFTKLFDSIRNMFDHLEEKRIEHEIRKRKLRRIYDESRIRAMGYEEGKRIARLRERERRRQRYLEEHMLD